MSEYVILYVSHTEVLVFGLLIAVYLVYMMLFALTDWSDTCTYVL